MRKKILLVNPPWYRLFNVRCIFPPLGLLHMASVLEEAGYRVTVYNADYSEAAPIFKYSQITRFHDRYIKCLNQISNPVWKEIQNTIQQLSPDLIGISAMTSTFQSALNVARLAKEISKDITVILGGFHPTLLPQATLKNKDIDIVVRGEGEYTLLETIKELNSSPPRLDKILGISFKKNQDIIHNPKRGLIQDLDILPFPARNRVIPKINLNPEIDFVPLIITRGCPYLCTYCSSHKIWGRKVRFRSPENIIEEIQELKTYFGLNSFHFYDDTLTLNSQFLQNLCQLILKKRLRIKWICQARINEISPSLLKNIKSAGCIGLNVGVESINPVTLRKINKRLNCKEIIRACKLIKQYEFELNIFMMFGFPWETKDDLILTEQFLNEADPDWVLYSHATPYPKTQLRKYYEEQKLLPKNLQWADFYQQSPKMFMAKEYSLEDMEAIFDKHNEKKLLERCVEYVKK